MHNFVNADVCRREVYEKSLKVPWDADTPSIRIALGTQKNLMGDGLSLSNSFLNKQQALWYSREGTLFKLRCFYLVRKGSLKI